MNFFNGVAEIRLRVRLHVHRDDVRPGVAKLRSIPSRLDNHQVNIQRQGCGGTDRLDHRNPDGNVGDKHTVHHVHMDIVGGGNFPNVPLQVRKVGGQDRRRYLDHKKPSFH
ncbi:hypothetical protein SDC9_86344 [bioreactor metagenome]|uniref:Uncharacterized protein n=1 Tax=bioreactor metagenome TaxID=1076179 RepID=A0A644ZFS6_9ZZZZ